MSSVGLIVFIKSFTLLELSASIKIMRRFGIYLLLICAVLLFIIASEKQVQTLLSQAAAKKANIIVHTNSNLGPLNRSWTNFAQGGEEPPPMLSSVIQPLKILTPSYIRIDHVYDSYSVVDRDNYGFTYDFNRLDKTVDDILATGAIPFLTLSYMPSVFTSTGAIIDPPSDWNYWKDLVKKTIEQYSGKNNKNINNVYYEIWNEPELPQFGAWKNNLQKDYRLLYYYAAIGATEAQNTNQFYIGGPSVGSYYPNWINQFLSYVAQNNLRLDFYSWHRYSKSSDIFMEDIKNTRKELSKFPAYTNTKLIISEWGIDSENTNLNSSNAAAAFTIASVSKFYKDLNSAFAFEIKDGPPPNGGKWGLITHQNDIEKKLFLKPRYNAFAALSQLKGDQIEIEGTGTFISAIASSASNEITVVLSNYDYDGENTENVPVTFTYLTSSIYHLHYEYPLNQTSGEFELVATDGQISKSFLMSPQSILILQLRPYAEVANFIQGKNQEAHDKAFLLNNQTPLTFSSPQFRLLPLGSIRFDIKPLWDASDNQTFYIFEAPFSVKDNFINKMFLAKKSTPEGNQLTFGISTEEDETSISIPLTNWQKNSWYHIVLEWNQNGLTMQLNDVNTSIETHTDIRNGKSLLFSPIDAALDNLTIFIGETESINRTFDGDIGR